MIPADLSKVMPFHFAISLFLGFFASNIGIYAARAIALCLRDIYEAITCSNARQSVDAPDFDPADHTWHCSRED